ncbi:hypothetical protein BGW38_003604, partial [Lunasporangiospora selenospora]
MTTASDKQDEGDEMALTPLGFNRCELVRIMVQSLQSLGYRQAAQSLVTESGFQLESAAVIRFRECVLAGNWDEVEKLTEQLELDPVLRMPVVKFLIREQKFLELLEARKIKDALVVLRSELTPLNHNMERVHTLTSYMMTSSADDLRHRAQWDGVMGASRKGLLASLQTIMVPELRLEKLLQQAVEIQSKNCSYHDSRNATNSLYSDHHCNKTGIPSITRKILTAHEDEVWCIAFSHDGRYLASTSADNSIIIWSLETFEPMHTLQGHTNKVTCCAWSPDDTRLLTAGYDRTVKLWDVQNCALLSTFQRHTDVIGCLGWLPDNARFVSGSERQTFLMSTSGEAIHSWTFPVRDLAISPDGKTLIAIGGTIIRLINLQDLCEMRILEETNRIMAINLSLDGKYLLVNTTVQPTQQPVDRVIHLWNIAEGRIEQQYSGSKQGVYVIRSCFGGFNERFVACGSEDWKINIWHRQNGDLLQTLEGHTNSVTCVAWNPTNPTMLATASDDHTIR